MIRLPLCLATAPCRSAFAAMFVANLIAVALCVFGPISPAVAQEPDATDQTAVPFDSTSPVPATSILYPGSTVHEFRGKDNFGRQFDLDLRYRNANRETRGTYIAAGRATLDWVRANPLNRDERGGVRLQFLVEDDDISGTALRRLRTSELYGYYTFISGGVSARVRVGQFVLPFGLIAVYDTPLQPIQPLYDKALGLRVDTGIMLEGAYGLYRYAGSITTGTGPNRSDLDGNKVISFRLSRTIETRRFGQFEVGGSLLSGRLPVTSFDYELPPSGTSRERNYIDKTRFAGDVQYFRGPISLRGELIFGGDETDAVSGYFVQGDYRFADRLTVVGFRKRWSFPIKPQASTTTGIGLNYHLGGDVVLRALYEYERDVPPTDAGNPFVTKRITLQTRLAF